MSKFAVFFNAYFIDTFFLYKIFIKILKSRIKYKQRNEKERNPKVNKKFIYEPLMKIILNIYYISYINVSMIFHKLLLFPCDPLVDINV